MHSVSYLCSTHRWKGLSMEKNAWLTRIDYTIVVLRGSRESGWFTEFTACFFLSLEVSCLCCCCWVLVLASPGMSTSSQGSPDWSPERRPFLQRVAFHVQFSQFPQVASPHRLIASSPHCLIIAVDFLVFRYTEIRKTRLLSTNCVSRHESGVLQVADLGMGVGGPLRQWAASRSLHWKHKHKSDLHGLLWFSLIWRSIQRFSNADITGVTINDYQASMQLRHLETVLNILWIICGEDCVGTSSVWLSPVHWPSEVRRAKKFTKSECSSQMAKHIASWRPSCVELEHEHAEEESNGVDRTYDWQIIFILFSEFKIQSEYQSINLSPSLFFCHVCF